MAVTTKVQDEANSLLEFFLGYKRMNGERIDKEDAVSMFIREGVKSHLPSDALALFEKGKKSPAKGRAA